jgi:hypothetical protein
MAKRRRIHLLLILLLPACPLLLLQLFHDAFTFSFSSWPPSIAAALATTTPHS